MNHTPTTLQELHDDYAEKVNLAVAEGRDDLVQALADEFATATTLPGRGAAQADLVAA